MKYAWIDEHRDQYTVSRLCRLSAAAPYKLCPGPGGAPSQALGQSARSGGSET